MLNKKTAAYCSLGCKVNQYDTEAMRELMERAGYVTVPFDDIADVYIINTCSVTHVSDRKSRQMISRAHTQNAGAVIVVCGCYAKTNPEAVSALPGVNIILGTNDRNDIVNVIDRYLTEKRSGVFSHIADDTTFEDLSADESEKTRAYLKIQDGCNRFCSYCIIPYARGRIRSRTLDSTKRELERLSAHGYREVVLTGIHLMSYGMDFRDGTDITDVLKLAETIDGIDRVRLGSLEPEFVTEKFVETCAKSKKVCRQFHLALQSGSDTVLKRMNRKYTTDKFMQGVNALREAMPDCAVTTDIIAGFVGETEEEHRETLDFVKKAEFARVHVFPYSVREGTVAAKMSGHVSPDIKDRRAHEIAALAAELQIKYMEKFIGTEADVLIEEPCDGGMRGLTDTYIDVHTNAPETAENEIIKVKITVIEGKHLVGEIV